MCKSRNVWSRTLYNATVYHVITSYSITEYSGNQAIQAVFINPWFMWNVRWGHWYQSCHDDVIKWKHFPRCWPFLRGIHRWIPHAQRSVTRSFDFFFDLRSNKRLSKQWWGWWFETSSSPLWRHCNVNWKMNKFVCAMPDWTDVSLLCVCWSRWAILKEQNLKSRKMYLYWPPCIVHGTT